MGTGAANSGGPSSSTLRRRDGYRGGVRGRKDATPLLRRRGAGPTCDVASGSVRSGSSSVVAAPSLLQNLPSGPRSAWRLALPRVPLSVSPVAPAPAARRRARPSSRGGWLTARRRRDCVLGTSGRLSSGAYRNKPGSANFLAVRLSAIGLESRVAIGGTAGAGSVEGWPTRSLAGAGSSPFAKKLVAHTLACATRQFSCARVVYALQMSGREPPRAYIHPVGCQAAVRSPPQ